MRAGLVACALVAAASAVVAVADLLKAADLVSKQLQGQAQGTDFLNLYSGAWLTVHAPTKLYDLAEQLAVQQGLTGWASPIVPFYLPPHAALLIGWLALLPYGIAYLVWLVVGVACLILAAWLIAPRPHVGWTVLAVLFLPCLLALVQGQTTALMLLAFAVLQRFRTTGSWVGALAIVAWTLKPQLALWLIVWLLLERRFGALVRAALIVGALTLAALPLLGASGFATYSELGHAKLLEAFTGEPVLLPGPTLLYAAQWLFGVGALANVLGLAGVALASVAFFRARQRAMALPLVAVIAAPYALVHELMLWLGTVWLVWPQTHYCPPARVALVWLVAITWAIGDSGVIWPTQGGDALAAILGLLSVWLLATRYDATPRTTACAK